MVQWMDSEAALGSCGVVAVWRMVMVLPDGGGTVWRMVKVLPDGGVAVWGWYCPSAT